MPIILECQLECDTCGNTGKGSLLVSSPARWIVRSPDDWNVAVRCDEDDDVVALDITCCADCKLQLNPIYKA